MCSPEGPLEGFLSRNLETIIVRFVAEVRREDVPPSGTSRAQLVDHLPAFIEEISQTLAHQVARPSVVEHESKTAREHGQNRWALGYDVQGLVREYGILGRAILELVEEEGLAVPVREFKVLARRLDIGVNEAVAEYVKYRDGEIKAQKDAQAFLFEAGALLMSSLDLQSTLRRLARLMVPRLADWCTVQVEGSNGESEILVAHAEPEREQALRAAYQRLAPPADWVFGYPFAHIEGDPRVHDESEAGDEVARRELFAEADGSSWMVVPLRARHGLIGAMTFVRGATNRPYAHEARALAVAHADHFHARIDARRRAVQHLRECIARRHEIRGRHRADAQETGIHGQAPVGVLRVVIPLPLQPERLAPELVGGLDEDRRR